MPYKIKGKCIYKKDTGKKVGCTKGSVKKYMKALHANVEESLDTSHAGDLKFVGTKHSKDKTKVRTEYSCPDGKVLHLVFSAEGGDFLYGHIMPDGIKFEDPAQQSVLDPEAIEMAAQDSYDKIDNQGSEDSMQFESLFNKVMNLEKE